MINFFLAMLAVVLCGVHIKVPFALLQAVRKAQADFDNQIISKEPCRSNFEETNRRIFRFSQQGELPCYFERIDFGTIETKGHWPKSVCILLNHTHGNPLSTGAETCSYL